MYKGRQIVLASASPRRKELLKSLGFQFKVIPPKIDEEIPPNLSPAEIVEYLASLKAKSVASRLKNIEDSPSFGRAIIIGADTLVLCNGNIIGKPKDREEAIRILTQLSGTRHSVFTGICIIDTVTGKKLQGHRETFVQMRRISKAEIEEYVDSGGSMGKAGAYAIQEDNDKFVEEIEGSFSNVVGLPLDLLQEMLEKLN
ncbi:MAG: septum formation protein Maf [Planctomycetes bacterium]|nr:septum formation protein Maf [Planctomycetota bacterium]